MVKIGVYLWKLSQIKTGLSLFWTTLYYTIIKTVMNYSRNHIIVSC